MGMNFDKKDEPTVNKDIFGSLKKSEM